MVQLPDSLNPLSTPTPKPKHPLHRLRLTLIALFSTGIAFRITSYLLSSTFYANFRAPFAITFAALSILLAVLDLRTFARDAKIGLPRTWPSKATLYGDMTLGVMHQVLFWGSIIEFVTRNNGDTLEEYAFLTDFVGSFVHFRTWWKEVIERGKMTMLQELESQPCGRCGYRVGGGLHSVHVLEQQAPPPYNVACAGPRVETGAV